MIREKLYKVPLPIAGIFILSGLFILSFPLIIITDDGCSESRCKDYSTTMLISYGLIFISLISWYLLFYLSCKKKEKESCILRIPAENDNDRIIVRNT